MRGCHTDAEKFPLCPGTAQLKDVHWWNILSGTSRIKSGTLPRIGLYNWWIPERGATRVRNRRSEEAVSDQSTGRLSSNPAGTCVGPTDKAPLLSYRAAMESLPISRPNRLTKSDFWVEKQWQCLWGGPSAGSVLRAYRSHVIVFGCV